MGIVRFYIKCSNIDKYRWFFLHVNYFWYLNIKEGVYGDFRTTSIGLLWKVAGIDAEADLEISMSGL